MSQYTPPYTITTKILKLSTQISEALTKLQLHSGAKPKPLQSDQESNQKSDQKILSMSESGIKKLKEQKSLKRVGSLKSGYWEVKR
jgi:hypothetical protein